MIKYPLRDLTKKLGIIMTAEFFYSLNKKNILHLSPDVEAIAD